MFVRESGGTGGPLAPPALRETLTWGSAVTGGKSWLESSGKQLKAKSAQTAMQIPIFTVDAFTNRPFSGNPAAVCLLENVSLKNSCFMKDDNGIYHSVLGLSAQHCIRLCFLYSGVLLASIVCCCSRIQRN